MVARYASTNPQVRVIAVAARSARRADVVAFVRERFGSAPIRVVFDPSGRTQAAFSAPAFPQYRFVTRTGRLTATAPRGFPYR